MLAAPLEKAPSIPGISIFVFFASAFFYSPFLGLARLVPALEMRILREPYSYDPAATLIVGLIYAVVLVYFFNLGKKRYQLAAPDAAQESSEAAPQPSEGHPEETPDGINSDPGAIRPKRHLALTPILFALTALFLVLWIATAQDKSALALLVKSSADAAQNSFYIYEESKDEQAYWHAAADFKAFEQSYVLFCEKAGCPESGAQCSEIYDILSNDSGRAKMYWKEISSRLTFWENGIGFKKGYDQMAELHAILMQ